MIRIEDFGEVAYGGAVTLSEWWDNKRIVAGTLATKDVFKKASFYTYLGVGLVATLMSAFGWMSKYERWSEKISTGFLYDLPRFAYNLSKTLSAAGGSRSSGSTAVREAQRILQQRQTTRQITEGQATQRSYQPEFNKTMAW